MLTSHRAIAIPAFYDMAEGFGAMNRGDIRMSEQKIDLYSHQSSRELTNVTGLNWFVPIKENYRFVELNTDLVNNSMIGATTAQTFSYWLSISPNGIPVEDERGGSVWSLKFQKLIVVVLDNNSSIDPVLDNAVRLLSWLPYPAYRIYRNLHLRDFSKLVPGDGPEEVNTTFLTGASCVAINENYPEPGNYKILVVW